MRLAINHFGRLSPRPRSRYRRMTTSRMQGLSLLEPSTRLSPHQQRCSEPVLVRRRQCQLKCIQSRGWQYVSKADRALQCRSSSDHPARSGKPDRFLVRRWLADEFCLYRWRVYRRQRLWACYQFSVSSAIKTCRFLRLINIIIGVHCFLQMLKVD
jgi:transposase